MKLKCSPAGDGTLICEQMYPGWLDSPLAKGALALVVILLLAITVLIVVR